MIVKFGSMAVIEKEKVKETAPERVKKLMESKDPNFLYFTCRAITADVPNGNGDYFAWNEIQSSYQTFIGQHIDYNHQMVNPTDIIGKIVDAWLEEAEKDKYVMVLGKIDKIKNADIARQIELGILDHVSMEATVQASKCSVCGHVIKNASDKKCEHLEHHLLHDCEFQGKTAKCYSINSGITFTGLGVVLLPADPQAAIKTIVAKLLAYAKENSANDFVKAQFDQIQKVASEQDRLEITAQVKNLYGGELTVDKTQTQPAEVPEVKTSDERVEQIVSTIKAVELLPLKRKVDTIVNAVADSMKTPAPVVTATVEVKATGDVVVTTPETITTGTATVVETTPAGVVVVKTEDKVEAKLVNKAKLEDSYWVIFVNEKPVYKASLKDIWGEELAKEEVELLDGTKAKHDDFTQMIQSDDYRTVLETSIKEKGLAVVAREINAQEWPTQRQIGKDQYTPAGPSGHESANAKAIAPFKQNEREVEKSKRDVKTVYEIGLKSGEKLGLVKVSSDGSIEVEGETLTVKADDMAKDSPLNPQKPPMGPKPPMPDMSKGEDGPKKLDAPKPPIAGPKPPVPPMGKDKKKPMTPEEAVEALEEAIPVLTKRHPSLTKDIKSLEKVLEKIEEEIKEEKEKATKEKKDEPKKEEPKKEEPKKEEKSEKPGEETPKEPPKAPEIPKKESQEAGAVVVTAEEVIVTETKVEVAPVVEPVAEEVKTETPATTASVQQVPVKSNREIELEQELNQRKLDESIEKKKALCTRVLKAMVSKGMVKLEQRDVEEAKKSGLPLIDAQNDAFKKSLDRQYANFWKMDDNSLRAFEESVNAIPIRAERRPNGLSTPISPRVNVTTVDGDELFLQAILNRKK